MYKEKLLGVTCFLFGLLGQGSASVTFNPETPAEKREAELIAVLFSISYGFLLLIMFYIRLLRKRATEPIIGIHRGRRDPKDFSALADSRINQIVAEAAGDDPIYWADVSFRIPTMKEFVPTFIFFGCGVLAIVICFYVPSIQEFSVFVLLITIIPSVIFVVTGIQQLWTKKHYRGIYVMTASGTILISTGSFGNKQETWPYQDITNVQLKDHGNGLYSVLFGEVWERQMASEVQEYGGSNSTAARAMWHKMKTGFINIVRGDEVARLLQDQVTRVQSSGSIGINDRLSVAALVLD